MQYSFTSRQQHNFVTFLKAGAYKLVWPLILIGLLYFLFPDSDIVKEHIHLYIFLAIEVINLFSVSKDFINEIIIGNSGKNMQVKYYNIYQGQMEERMAFDKIKIDIATSRKKEPRHIIFFIKGKNDFLVDKHKDKFNQQELDSLAATLYNITSPKML